MILKSLKRVAADSNVLLSAVIGKAALKAFTQTHLEVITTEFNIKEVEEYLPHLAKKYEVNYRQAWLQLRMLPVIIVKKNYYKNEISSARKYLDKRDPDDIHLAALALKEQIPIWSNDHDFNVLPLNVYPTRELLRLFDL